MNEVMVRSDAQAALQKIAKCPHVRLIHVLLSSGTLPFRVPLQIRANARSNSPLNHCAEWGGEGAVRRSGKSMTLRRKPSKSMDGESNGGFSAFSQPLLRMLIVYPLFGYTSTGFFSPGPTEKCPLLLLRCPEVKVRACSAELVLTWCHPDLLDIEAWISQVLSLKRWGLAYLPRPWTHLFNHPKGQICQSHSSGRALGDACRRRPPRRPVESSRARAADPPPWPAWEAVAVAAAARRVMDSVARDRQRVVQSARPRHTWRMATATTPVAAVSATARTSERRTGATPVNDEAPRSASGGLPPSHLSASGRRERLSRGEAPAWRVWEGREVVGWC